MIGSSRAGRFGYASHVVGGTAAGLIGGMVDAVVNLAAGSASSGAAATIALTIGLWGISGTVVGAVAASALRLSFGPGAWARLSGALVSNGRRFVYDRGTVDDRRRVALVLATAVGIGLWLAASAASLAWLVEHRHGAWLIAVTALGLQLVFAPAAALLGLAVWRAGKTLSSAAFLWRGLLGRVVTLPAVVVSSAVLATFLGAAIAAWQWKTIVAVDLPSLAGIAFIAAVGALAGPALGSRVPRLRTVAWAAPAACIALTLTAAQTPVARHRVATGAHGANYLLSALQGASDWDGDQIAYLPTFADCAPFDPLVHPLAPERSGDGVDSNCDGTDDPPSAEDLVWPAVGEATVPEGKPNLVLITVDSWRADTTGFGGSKLGLTPNLDAFAAKGVVFTTAFSQDSGTGPSLWSLAAGKTPFQTKIDSSGRFPPAFLPEERLLAEKLNKAGYSTAALLCGYVFAAKHWNLRRGFDDYREVCGRKKSLQAEQVTTQALATLRKLEQAKKPYFLWVHYYDPHEPYHDHSDPDRGSKPRQRYEEEVVYTDRALAPLLDELARQKSTHVAITADHGENFGEHGTAPHARTLYREVTHVPLVFRGPGVRPSIHRDPVAINDIHPTFLELAGVSREGVTMTSQAPVLFGATPAPDRLVFQENSFSRPKRHVKGVVGLGHHLLYDTTNNSWELYDLEADPRERDNLLGRGRPVEGKLREALMIFITTVNMPSKLAR